MHCVAPAAPDHRPPLNSATNYAILRSVVRRLIMKHHTVFTALLGASLLGIAAVMIWVLSLAPAVALCTSQC